MTHDNIRFNADRGWYEMEFSGRISAAEIIAKLDYMINDPD